MSIYRGWVMAPLLRQNALKREVLNDPDLICPLRQQVRSTLPWYRRIFWW